MGKIPKEIVKRIEELNYLGKDMDDEILKWFDENLDTEGCNVCRAEIVSEYVGKEQGSKDCKEWVDQKNDGEFCSGRYYWETEIKGKYLKMVFSI